MLEIKPASKKGLNLHIAMCGESNSGKTFSSLTLLKGMLGDLSNVVVVDTENRANLYADEFKGYKVLPITSPFDPEKLVDALKLCAESGAKGVVVDSGSDFWERTLAIHASVTATCNNNKFLAWARVGPRWDAFKGAISGAPFHVITCWRMKDHLVQVGQKIEKQGMKVIGRGGNKGVKFEYEIVFTLDERHQALVVKDNIHQFGDWKEPKAVDEGVGVKIKNWLLK